MEQVELILNNTRSEARKVLWDIFSKAYYKFLVAAFFMLSIFSFFDSQFRIYGLLIFILFVIAPFVCGEIIIWRKCKKASRKRKDKAEEIKLIFNSEGVRSIHNFFKWDHFSDIIETRCLICIKHDRKPMVYIFKRHYSEGLLSELKSILATVPVENKKLYIEGKVLKCGARRPIKWRYVFYLLMLISGFALFYYSVIGTPFSRMQQFVVPGEHLVQIDKSGSYHIFYDCATSFQGRDFATNKDQYKKLTCSLFLDAAKKEITLLDDSDGASYNFNNKRTGFTILKFEIDKPGSYIFKADYENEKQVPEIVFGIRSSYSGLEIILMLLGLPLSGGLVLLSVILFLVTFLSA